VSTHEVKVIRVGQVQKHQNADTLGLLTIHGGYTCVVRLGQFPEGSLAAYIEPDYDVPLSRPEFGFLKPKDKPVKEWERIRVKRLRGVLSHGLLIAAPDGAQEGDNVIDALGVRRYEPPMHMTTRGEAESPPQLYAPCYDVEPLRKYVHVFEPGEPVIVTEKIHGANGRFVYHDGRMWCGSRTEWKRESESNLWWQALRASPWLETWCTANPDHVVYGEVYGQVQNLKYGHAKGSAPSVAVFDVLLPPTGEWADAADLYKGPDDGLQLVPLVAGGVPFDWEAIQKLADGKSLVSGADHMREGVVVKPLTERVHLEVGRVNLKLVSDDYLERG
jgi:RNA ligase (TIGR02306 family)